MLKSLLLLVFLIPLYVISADAAITSPVPVASFFDGTDYDALGGAHRVSTVIIDDAVYALVTGNWDAGVQIVNITTPSSPVPVASFFDGTDYDALQEAYDIATVLINGTTYALVTGNWDAGIQIVNITMPSTPTPVASFFGRVVGGSYQFLDSPHGITTINITGKTYALITDAFHDGVQIIDITTPSTPVDKGFFDDSASLALDSAENIATVVIDGTVYALVTGSRDDGVQIIDITTPGSPSHVASFFNGTSVGDKTYDALDGAYDIATVFIDNIPYALVTGVLADGVQIIDITTPSAPVPVASFFDGDSVGSKTYFKLDGARSVTTVSVDGDTYALVASTEDHGVQIIDITTPSAPVPVTSFRDGDSVGDKTYDALERAFDIATVVIDGTAYALVASNGANGVQIVSLNSSGAMSETTPPTFSVDGKTDDYTTILELGASYTRGTIRNIDDASGTDGGQTIGANEADTSRSGTYLVTYTVTDNASRARPPPPIRAPLLRLLT